MDKGRIGSDADTILVHYGEERDESEGEALNLQVNLHSNPHLRSRVLGSHQRVVTSRQTSFLHRVLGSALEMRSLE